MQATMGFGLMAAPLGLRARTSRRTAVVGACSGARVHVSKSAVRLSSKNVVASRGALMARVQAQQGVARKQLVVRAVDDPDNPNVDEGSIMSPATGRPNAVWRVLACLPYLVPLMGSLAFGTELYDKYPLTSILILVFQPLLQAYYSNSFTPFIVFFALFLVVVRSQKLPHFLRFNALQSMLVDISVMLGGLVIQYLPFEIQFSWLGKMANMLTFVTGTGAVAYSVFYTLQGKYCDIPVISEAVYIQIQR